MLQSHEMRIETNNVTQGLMSNMTANYAYDGMNRGRGGASRGSNRGGEQIMEEAVEEVVYLVAKDVLTVNYVVVLATQL